MSKDKNIDLTENHEMTFRDEGVEFLKNMGISEVSNRTFIHEEELSRFLNGDFKHINKAKAMGFIQILQREYRIDLTNLKNRYLEYYKEHHGEEELPRENLIMEEVKNEARARKITTLIFLFLSIGAIAYLVNKYHLLNFETNNYDNIEMAKIDDTEPNLPSLLESHDQKQEQKQKKVDSTTSNTIDLNKVLESKSNQNELSNTNTISQNTQEIQEKNNQNSDVEVTTNSNIINSESSNQQNELDLSQLNSDLAKKNSETTQNNNLVASDNSENLNINDINDSETIDNSNNEATINELYIIPKAKAWIGTIDLDTLKKKDFLAKPHKRVDIDTSSNKLIMIGHRYIKVYFNGKLVKFKRRGPVRFKYIDGELTEIGRKEFNKLAKGRQW